MSRKFQTKVIPSTWLTHNGRRLDCGPYMSGAIEAIELLKKLRTETLETITDGIFHAGREGRQYVVDAEYGVPFMGSTDILAFDLSSQPLLSKRQVEKNPNFTIRKGWTLITRSGTTGRMAYGRKAMDGMACSEHVMRVVPNTNKVQPGYLYAFLSSRFGIPIVVSGTYGSIIQSIEPHQVANLPVPRLGLVEGHAHQLVEESAQLLSLGQNQLNEATNLFFSSVGLSDITQADWHSWGSDLGFSSNVDIRSLRALNYNQRFCRLVDMIKSTDWKSLEQICLPGSIKRGGRYNRIDADPEHSYHMIGQKEIFWLRPEGRWIAKSCVDKEVLVEPGTILIAGAGTFGEFELYCRSELIWGKAAERAYSELFYRVIADEGEMLPGCLFAFMRSEIAFRMIRSISFGSKLQYPLISLLHELPVPYPSRQVQDEINQLVINAYESRDRAIELEDQARTLVEQAIEKGGW
ncbi:methylation-associated defense system restriction endonuclease subunit S MAD5 [Methylosarcina fibrata]|uniref:methylation-associated defense system restriction endonuclease subunit S MAD5 n=1 Tax=Methylosarcina fibrata TaxID=105972 RepID=UPI000475FBEB|nr:restriction endonuclease subunit S [Methylosarcina fibrata]